MRTSDIIGRAMEEQKKSVIEIGRDLKVSPAIIYRWLSGETNISMRTIRLWILDPELPNYVHDLARELLREPVGDERAMENG